LENFSVAVGDDPTDELSAGGLDGSDDVASQVSAVVALSGMTAALDPAGGADRLRSPLRRRKRPGWRDQLTEWRGRLRRFHVFSARCSGRATRA
jgi:hypothetical protein